MRLRLKLIPLLLGTALSLVFAAPSTSQMQTDLSEFAAGTAPSFNDPSAALERFKTVLSANDLDGLANLLGLDAAKLRSSNEAMISYGLIREGAARQLRLQDLGDRKIVSVGDVLWPLPFPLSQDKDGKWAFDTAVGLQEIVNRRIGANELATIQTMQDYVAAQREYASEDRDGDGIYEYAQKLISSPGKVDGLYWDPSVYGEDSPASALVQTAAFDKAKRGEGYFGYRYRILTGQGENVLGGKQSYVVNGHMTAGFALLAWPVKYRVTGVQTFIINGVSVIYERDLGPQTEERAAGIKDFNPDSNWTTVRD
ncbi:DUF2950 family protein [Rhizobium sp. SEMIA 4085]|uniref:DUF2950 domain-containing protein n=1 Tax=Rhizobium gallicum bv. gallicum R602sp TaxID=1041138 RepID=A0A0B4X5U0_9HYPH|nr:MULTISPECIES: DUF2950 family protein [Rhizobium]AJD42501.1 hypothetical protein RGR602_CH03185 [Rhizobium gallicum bv. gallicum R602sp]NNH29342.1 DUF2950 family protein [Rhizobium sp. SEMIA 4085]